MNCSQVRIESQKPEQVRHHQERHVVNSDYKER